MLLDSQWRAGILKLKFKSVSERTTLTMQRVAILLPHAILCVVHISSIRITSVVEFG